LYFYLGTRAPGRPTVGWHSPQYFVDESALLFGVRAFANLAVDFLRGRPRAK